MTHCLIVDDSSVVRKVARRILEDFGWTADEAEDGQRALEACGSRMPEVILLDWSMPVMDGFQFMRSLRTMPGGDQPTIVFCTTEYDVAQMARAMRAGADGFVMKPFDRSIIEQKFQEIGLL